MNKLNNAYKGQNVESLFKNSIKNQDVVIDKIKDYFQIDKQSILAKTYKTGTDAGKADVMIRFSNGNSIAANIKSYKGKGIGFNQATRMRVNNFVNKFNLPHNIEKMLIENVIRKAKNSRQEPFILPEQKGTILQAISKVAKDIISYSICGDEAPELFVLWNESKRKMSIYIMKLILEEMYKCIKLDITNRGVIILNPFFTIQRKGGNGKHDKHDKIDINHGGNNIQVKINTEKFEEEILSLCFYEI